MNEPRAPGHPVNLLDHVAGTERLQLTGLQEAAWIEVIRKMDEVYSDVIRYEVDLEKKNAALKEAQSFITSVVESVSDVLIVCDWEGRVQQVNPAMLKLTGLPEEALIGRSMEDLLADEDRALFGRCLGNLENKTLRDCEVRWKVRNGAISEVVAVNCSIRFDLDGHPAGMVLTGRPVGELRRAYEALNQAHAELVQAQQQLIQQEKMASLGRLVAGVAHELNNPISFIYGNIYTLERYLAHLLRYLDAVHGGAGEAEREDLKRALNIDSLVQDLPSLIEGTREGAVRVRDIVKNLRRLSFVSGTESESFDLTKTVKTAVQWAARGSRRPAEITVHMPDAISVHGQSGQIHQVVVNLVQNAFDAVGEKAKPRISVVGEVDAGHIKVTVSDNGPSVREEDLLKVFEPFFTTKPVGKGTGLGLWISYGIIKEHGGTLEVRSRPEGGVAFSFLLPTPGRKTATGDG